MLPAAKLVVAASFASLLLAGGSVASEEPLTKGDAVAMVKAAVAFIEEHGPDMAYPEISSRSGKFVDRELYVVVQSLGGKVLAHGADKTLLGADQRQVKDIDGKPYVKERLELAGKEASFWHSYQSTNPVSKDIEPKQTYCERLNNTVICAGIYTPLPPPGGC